MSESKNSICAAYFFFPLPSQFEAINLCITDNPVAGTSPRQLHRFSRDSMGLFWLWEAGWWRRSKMPGRDHQDSCLKSRGKSATCPGRRWKRTLLRKRGRREVVLREVRWWRKSSLAEMGKSHVPAGERGTQKRRQQGGECKGNVWGEGWFLCMDVHLYEQEACYRSNPQMWVGGIAPWQYKGDSWELAVCSQV